MEWTGERVILKKADPSVFKREKKPKKVGRQYLEYEYEIQSQLAHPNVCPAISLERHKREPYLVLPEVGTTSLQDLVDEGTPRERIISTLADIADALIYMHSQNVVHLDVKEDNVMVNGKGTLIDYESARVIGTEHPISNSRLMCTTDSMAPEYLFGEFDSSADTFSYAIMTYRALLGEIPFPVDTDGMLVYDIPLFGREQQEALGDIGELILAGLNIEPEDRPPLYEIAQVLREQTSTQNPQYNEQTSEPSLSPA